MCTALELMPVHLYEFTSPTFTLVTKILLLPEKLVANQEDDRRQNKNSPQFVFIAPILTLENDNIQIDFMKQ